jgi:uncharacterized membrane protein
VTWDWQPAQVAGVVAIVAISGAVAWLLTTSLVKAATHPAPTLLVASLSVLSLAALLGGLLWDSDSAIALAGAGIGAIAGAVSSTFNGPKDGGP